MVLSVDADVLQIIICLEERTTAKVKASAKIFVGQNSINTMPKMSNDLPVTVTIRTRFDFPRKIAAQLRHLRFWKKDPITDDCSWTGATWCEDDAHCCKINPRSRWGFKNGERTALCANKIDGRWTLR